jgi:hypothetical protein
VRGETKRGEKVLLLFLPLGTKHWNLPLAIELGSSFISFLLHLFKRANSDHLGLSFRRIIFYSTFENTCSHDLLVHACVQSVKKHVVKDISMGHRKKMIILGRW